jgi:hypothetical protein
MALAANFYILLVGRARLCYGACRAAWSFAFNLRPVHTPPGQLCSVGFFVSMRSQQMTITESGS